MQVVERLQGGLQLQVVHVMQEFFRNWPSPDSFPFIFRLFKKTLQFLPQIHMRKNVHPIYGAVIQTHNLQTMSLIQ